VFTKAISCLAGPDDDVMTLGIDGLGQQRQRVVAWHQIIEEQEP
jgi:hypothetical protein